MKLHWLIDIDLLDKKYDDIFDHLTSLGYGYTKISVTKDLKINKEEDTIYTFLGSFEGLREVKKHVSIATYGLNDNVKCHVYRSYVPEHLFLNKDAVLTTFGSFKNDFHSHYDFDLLNGYEVFIRPDSGDKTFTGQVIEYDKCESELEFIEHHNHIKPETLIWVSCVKPIDDEYRFWIADRKIIGSSSYSWDSNAVTPVKTQAFELARKICEMDWQVDLMYTVDIHVNKFVTSIVEFNSFTCAGLYDVNLKRMLEQASLTILKEWE